MQDKNRDTSPHRGDIWFANLGKPRGGSVQNGCRPVLIVSNDIANRCADIVTVLPMTTSIKKEHMPTHVMLPKERCIYKKTIRIPHRKEDSMILAEQVTTLDKSALVERLGRVTDEGKLQEINTAMAVQQGLSEWADTYTTTERGVKNHGKFTEHTDCTQE